jgi:hypothetical protein
MQQQIGFCTTTGGARIAYATVGAGPALVVANRAPSHLGLEWEEPRVRAFWEAIGRHHLVVRYDNTDVVCLIGTGPTSRSTPRCKQSRLSSRSLG